LDAERLYLNWGEPKAIERLMDTVRALQGIILRNPAGHMHFTSNWYGGRKVYREGPWEWQKPYSFTVLHAPILIGVYNANPAARALVTATIDGWMAHGRQGADGRWTFPNEINWRTDAERVGDRGGLTTPLQGAWASYRWTGDSKYLRPLQSRAAEGPGVLAEINENVVDLLGRRKDWGAALTTMPASPFEQYQAWQATGDKSFLERLHADAIRTKSQNMYMLTEGHWWSDRVEQSSDILQRERLGGIALKRNQVYPGNLVSWRFAAPDGAEQVAILIPGGTPERFKVIAYNMSDRAQSAVMTGWDVAPGTWRMTAGEDLDGDDQAGSGAATRELALERSTGVELSFAPRRTTIIEFELAKAGTPVEQRPDLGISADDAVIVGRELRVTVHSLGSSAAEGGRVRVEDSRGRLVAEAPVPGLAAPADLLPRTATVRLRLPSGFRASGARVTLAVPYEEITRLNNTLELP
jgi:hypothetical protein